MKEVNGAYEEIQKLRSSGYSGRASGGYGSQSYAGNTSSSGNPRYAEVRRLINSGNDAQAESILNGVHEGDRNAEWYFLNGTVLYRRGWFDQAYTSFATAVRMNPQNPEYRNAMNNAQRQSGQQYNPYRSYGYGGGCNTCDVCNSLICADCCCECMGGDLIPCC